MTEVGTGSMSTREDGIPCPARTYPLQIQRRRSSQNLSWEYTLPKREPVNHEERNDSGINSESDFQSSSPGSDQGNNVLCSSSRINQMIPPILDYYSTPLVKMDQSTSMTCEQYNNRPTHLYDNEHNVLSPPNSEPLGSPDSPHNVTLTSSNVEVKREMNDSETALTPCASPDDLGTPQTSSSSENNNDDPFRGLQMTFKKNGLPLPLSVLFGDKYKPPNVPTSYTPIFDLSGKRKKKLKCKQCSFECFIKADFWEHTKEHIKVEKRLTCSKCPFVTEYKHHLEYHLRNHNGDKPFKCNQCSYECVNKSMLNSHLKSHSNVHQYRCADCHYKTKYCHSLKKHLRTENHKPAMVLNPDGTPNPLPIIDIYGSRRGPKVKNQEHMPLAMGERSPPPETGVPFPLNQFPPNLQLPFPAFPFFPGFPGVLANPLILQNLEKYMREAQGSLVQEETPQHMETEAEVLDLSKTEGQRNRRKGQAMKLTEEQDDSDDEGLTTMFSNVEVVVDTEASTSASEAGYDAKEEMSGNNDKDDYKCRFCNIYFGDSVLHTMHMGYHGYNNPFACNMCGEVCEDKISFFVHIARTSHS